MFCINCGNQIADGSAFCPVCGVAQGAVSTAVQMQAAPQGHTQAASAQAAPGQGVYQQPYNQNYPQGTAQQPYQQGYPQGMYQQGYNQGYGQPAAPAIGMTWHKVLQVLLCIGALFNLVNTFRFLSGSVYGDRDVVELVYSFYPALRVTNILYGLVVLALVVFDIVIVIWLHGLKKHAPTMLLSMYATNVITGILYMIVVFAIVGTRSVGSVASLAGSIIGTVVMIVVNKIYYDNRKHLFIN